jgi:hypothetical protein
MNQDRRSFLKKIGLGLFGFAILPPAETYQRVWRATRPPVLQCFDAFDAEYLCIIMEKPLLTQVYTTMWSPALIEKLGIEEAVRSTLIIENFSVKP